VPLVLTGLLHRRDNDYSITQNPSADDAHWTTPRIYRMLATPATRDDLNANVDSVVTLTGVPSYDVERHRSFVVVESVVPGMSGDN
jgi:hypothetical protein